nr:DUF481 domain-containing protein [Vibrio algicola]
MASKRLLPLLFLLCSGQVYCADANTTSTEITPDPVTSLSDETQSANPAASKTQAPESDNTTDSEIDDAAIAKLLNEDDNKEEDEAPQEPSPWTSEIEFGYRSEQGNDDEQSLNTRLSLSYIKGRLRNNGEIKIYMKNEDGKVDEREQTYQLQSDYKLSPKMYAYGNFKGIDSKYDSYFHDYTISSGLGYQVTNTEDMKVEVEFGPGYRYQEPNTDEIDDDDAIFPENVNEPIIRANFNAFWKPFKNTSFNFEGTVVSGSSNTRFDSEISIVNQISESIALKIAQSRQHLSRVPNNLEKTDSTVTINLLFSFK